MKKIFTFILALTLLCAMSVPAFATDNTTGGTTNVTYSIDAKYTVTIPESVVLGAPDSPVNSNLIVDITNLPYNTCIKAAITDTSGADDAFTVKHTDSNKTLAYTVKYSNDDEAYSEYTLNSKVGGLIADGTIYFRYTLGEIAASDPSGNYSGSVTFTITNTDIIVD